MNFLSCQDKNILIRRNRRSKHLRLRVDIKGRVILSLPLGCSKRQAQVFLDAHQDWITTQLAHRPQAPKWQNGSIICILGQSLTICHNPTLRGGVFIQGDTLFVSGEASFLTRRISDFIKRQTANYIETKARSLASQIDVTFRQIHLKDTTFRWGSCSGKGNLNFCWRLGMAPLFVLDYIIAHEIAHLREMNHSDRFWHLVSRLTDRRADAEIWLRRHGHELSIHS